jgi:hypothetical protein
MNHRHTRYHHHAVLRTHLHGPTLDAVIEALYRADGIGSTREAVGLVDALRPPLAVVTMGDLFAHVVDEMEGYEVRRRDAEERVNEHEQEQEQEQDEAQGHEDSCEICGVRCVEMAFPPYPGLCAHCTVKVQMVQKEKTKGFQHSDYDNEYDDED